MGNIRYKGGNYTRDARSSYVQVEPLSVTANGTYTAESGKAYNPVTVNIQTASPNDVNFYDYDGTIVYSYTKEQFSELTEMPPNPTHTGLTAQGWNYTLEKAKEYVAAYGSLDVGQMYITSDGKTRAVIRLEEGRLSPRLGLGLNGAAKIDWGDGTAEETMTGSNIAAAVYKTHNYASAGEYTIAIAIEGSAQIFGSSNYTYFLSKNTTANENRIYSSAIRKLFLGNNISIGTYAFNYCYLLKSVTIPEGVTSIDDCAFNFCYSIVSMTIPEGVTTIGSNAFNSCYSLASVTIPKSVTTIKVQTFYLCYSLARVTIPKNVTTIEERMFGACNQLKSVTIPEGVTTIGSNAFSVCDSLKSVMIPKSVTTIKSYAFNSDYSLASVTIPEGVTTIEAGAFGNCTGFGFLKFLSLTPPAVANINAWFKIPTDCKILVPTGTLETYKAAANYPNPSSYTYEEYTE